MADERRKDGPPVVARRPGVHFCVLDRWKILHRTDVHGEVALCLGGDAFENSGDTTGKHVKTSAITGYRMEGERIVVITRSGSEYLLGRTGSPQSLGKERLIAYLKRLNA